MINNDINDSVESITPLSDYPHPRQVARERIAEYRGKYRLTQSAIDGEGKDRPLSMMVARAVRYRHVSLWRRLFRTRWELRNGKGTIK